jgi:hypothetical protein
MAELAASIIALTQVGGTIGVALWRLRRAMKHAEDEIRDVELRTKSITAIAEGLTANLKRYSSSGSAVAKTHIELVQRIVKEMKPGFNRIEGVLRDFTAFWTQTVIANLSKCLTARNYNGTKRKKMSWKYSKGWKRSSNISTCMLG